MKKHHNSILILALCLAFLSCGNTEKNENTSAVNMAKVANEKKGNSNEFIQEKFAELTDSSAAYSTGLQQKMTQWQEDSKSKSDDFKKDYQAKLNQLEEKQLALEKKVNEFKEASSNKKRRTDS